MLLIVHIISIVTVNILRANVQLNMSFYSLP